MIHDFCVGPRPLDSSVHTVFKEADTLTFSSFDVTVEAVVGDVSHAPFEPPVHVLVTRVNRLIVKSEPVDLRGLAIKEVGLVLN